MKKIRVLTLGLVATALLVWALPATAQRSATVVKVTAGKPSEFHFTLSVKTVKHGTVTFAVTGAAARRAHALEPSPLGTRDRGGLRGRTRGGRPRRRRRSARLRTPRAAAAAEAAARSPRGRPRGARGARGAE